MSAKASGADTSANGNASHRTHNDGSSARAFTADQKAAVIRVRRCQATAFYDILGLEAEKATVTDAGIKKAYRKLSLLTHPDKNGYSGADEAFKMVSRAFQILSDADKKSKYDKFGGDPDNRFNGASAASPFSGFARSPGARGGQMWEDEISPEELFRQFFGGGGFGGGGMGMGGFNQPGFVFNLGGGPGIRVHQFGGNRPRRRPAGATGRDDAQPPPTALSTLSNLLPLLLLFLLPLLSSLFSGSDSSTRSTAHLPKFNLDTPAPPYLHPRTSSTTAKFAYYVNPADFPAADPAAWPAKKWRELDQFAERRLVSGLGYECELEQRRRERLFQDAQGWFWADQEKLAVARGSPMRSCGRLRGLGYTM